MAEQCYAECHMQALYAEWHYAECLYAECRGAVAGKAGVFVVGVESGKDRVFDTDVAVAKLECLLQLLWQKARVFDIAAMAGKASVFLIAALAEKSECLTSVIW
jgi:hypothetical protein